jgi:hypothetical protein
MPVLTRSQTRQLLLRQAWNPTIDDPDRRDPPSRIPYRTARMQTGGSAPRRAQWTPVVSRRALFARMEEAMRRYEADPEPESEPEPDPVPGPDDVVLLRWNDQHLIPPMDRSLPPSNEQLATTPWHMLSSSLVPAGKTEWLDAPTERTLISMGTTMEGLETRNSAEFPGYLEKGPFFFRNDLWFETTSAFGIPCFYKLFDEEFDELVRRTESNKQHRMRQMLTYCSLHWITPNAAIET